MKKIGKYIITASLLLNQLTPLVAVSAEEDSISSQNELIENELVSIQSDTTGPVITFERDGELDSPDLISVYATDDESGISHMILPDGSMWYGGGAYFVAYENGSYTITAVNNEGIETTETIVIDDLDFVLKKQTIKFDVSAGYTIKEPYILELPEIGHTISMGEYLQPGSLFRVGISVGVDKGSYTNGMHTSYELISLEGGKVGIIPEASSGYDYFLLEIEGYSSKGPTVNYMTHVQSDGWQNPVDNGLMSGTSGEGKRLEGIRIALNSIPYEGRIEYQTHVQSYGWMDWVSGDMLSGTTGEAKRLEGIRIKLTGELAEHYDVYYRVHAQSYGWLDWAKNGESAGTEGLSKRLEAIKIQLVEKGDPAPGTTSRPYVISDASVSYTTHVQKQGWQAYAKDGSMSGTEGKALRLEGIKINVTDPALSGGIQYRTHVQKEGWQGWKANDVMSGTEGKALRLEAIEMKLTGALAEYYDVYYRVHAQSYGWLGWAKNGQSAGTEGLAKRLEGIEVKLIRKGQKAPGSTQRAFVKK